MKTYELIIREKQPACGGKDPTKVTLKTVSTDDPLGYVRALEPNCAPTVETEPDGTLVVTAERNGWTVRYEFTED